MLCQHNILGHSFLNAFRNHKVLLTVDPAAQRGLLPTSIALWLPDVNQQYLMLVELRYSDPNVDASETSPLVTSPPLSIESGCSALNGGYPCLTAALKHHQKIRMPLQENFDSNHLSFAVTIVRKRDAKCKRIFQFPSPSEVCFGIFDKAILFDCPSASDIALRDSALQALLSGLPVPGIDLALQVQLAKSEILQNRIRVPSGLQVLLGVVPGTDAYQAECVEIYSYGDDGELLEDAMRETLLRIEHVGRWF